MSLRQTFIARSWHAPIVPLPTVTVALSVPNVGWRLSCAVIEASGISCRRPPTLIDIQRQAAEMEKAVTLVGLGGLALDVDRSSTSLRNLMSAMQFRTISYGEVAFYRATPRAETVIDRKSSLPVVEIR